MSNFGKCGSNPEFAYGEPRPGVGTCPGSRRNSLQDPPSARSLSHRQKADIIQSTALVCSLCNVLKSLPASESRAHCSFAPPLASERLPWVTGKHASSGVPQAHPAQGGVTAVAILASTYLAPVPSVVCLLQSRNKDTALPRAAPQPWGGLAGHQGEAGSP